jgi:hypothetical protein
MVGFIMSSEHGATAVWRRLMALALVVAGVGLPINHLFGYALLVIATVLIFAGTMSVRLTRWLAAMGAVGLCVLGQMFLAAPRIEEGHNVFLVDGPGGALEKTLPGPVFRFMQAAFDAQYPPERRCDRHTAGCWRAQGLPDRPFAFSADAIYDRPLYSRRVTGIDLSDPVWAGLGFINEARYNWYGGVSDISRLQRERRFWMVLHPWRLTMPWFVMLQFPEQFVGSALCWRGDVLWEGAGDQFATLRHADRACRTIERADVGRRIFGVSIKPDSLTMSLAPTLTIRLWRLVEPALQLLAFAAVLGLLVHWRARAIALPFALIGLTLVVVLFNDASFIGGLRPFDGGDDGLVFDGWARQMVQLLLNGDIARALEGGESVFFFTPGTRYLRALERLIFGETNLGSLSLILLLPFLCLAMFRRFLPVRWALASTFIFIAIPIGAVFGTSLFHYVKWAARGFGDPAGYTLFLAGFVLLVGRPHGPDDRFAPAWGAGLLMALAIIIRPNIAPITGILVTAAGLAALWQRQLLRVAGLIVGFAASLAMALHNWVYGGVLVLISTSGVHPLGLLMPPSAWLAALGEVLRLNLAGDHVAKAVRQVGGWLTGPSESLLAVPLHAVAVAILLWVAACGRGYDPWLRLTAWATLAQHGVALAYPPYARYYYLTWLLTLLVVLVFANRVYRGSFKKPWSSASSSAPR